MDAKTEAELVAGAVSERYDVLIIGGGILGTATAMNLTEAGIRTVVLRLSDKSCPRADTLRNQGWLQSGILYSRKDFAGDDQAYRATVVGTFAAGHTMLTKLGIPVPNKQGLVRVVKDGLLHVKLEERRKLFRYKDFRELTVEEAQARLDGVPYEADSIYYNLPDVPFDEAKLIETFRTKAAAGARFYDLSTPVCFSKGVHGIRVHVGTTTVDPPVMLIAAGAGIAKFYTDIKAEPSVDLRQTPLLVYGGASARSLPPIFVDYERGFSCVRHDSTHVESGTAAVIGTKAREEDVSYVVPEARKISPAIVSQFTGHLSPSFQSFVSDSRFTAGVEVIPRRGHFLDAWVENLGSVVLASPGRATLGWDTAVKMAQLLKKKVDATHHGHTLSVDMHTQWTEPVHMHFSDRYATLNDI